MLTEYEVSPTERLTLIVSLRRGIGSLPHRLTASQSEVREENRAELRGSSARNQVARAGDGQGLSNSMPLAEAVQDTLDFGTRSILIMPSAPGVTLKVCVIAVKFIPYVWARMS